MATSSSSTSKKAKTTETQHARFIETARALGCDESEAAFDEKLKVIARHKPKGEPVSKATEDK